jgi:hypothetical protein
MSQFVKKNEPFNTLLLREFDFRSAAAAICFSSAIASSSSFIFCSSCATTLATWSVESLSAPTAAATSAFGVLVSSFGTAVVVFVVCCVVGAAVVAVVVVVDGGRVVLVTFTASGSLTSTVNFDSSWLLLTSSDVLLACAADAAAAKQSNANPIRILCLRLDRDSHHIGIW